MDANERIGMHLATVTHLNLVDANLIAALGVRIFAAKRLYKTAQGFGPGPGGW
jgi:hypothetical protein